MLICLLLANIVRMGDIEDENEKQQLEDMDASIIEMNDDIRSVSSLDLRNSLVFTHRDTAKAIKNIAVSGQLAKNEAQTSTFDEANGEEVKLIVYYYVHNFKTAIPENYKFCRNYLSGTERVCEFGSFELEKEEKVTDYNAFSEYTCDQIEASQPNGPGRTALGISDGQSNSTAYTTHNCILYKNVQYDIREMKTKNAKSFRVAWCYVDKDDGSYSLIEPFLVFLPQKEDNIVEVIESEGTDRDLLFKIANMSTFTKVFREHYLNKLCESFKVQGCKLPSNIQSYSKHFDDFIGQFAALITDLENININALHLNDTSKFLYLIKIIKCGFWYHINKFIRVNIFWTESDDHEYGFINMPGNNTSRKILVFSPTEKNDYLILKNIRGDLFIVHKSCTSLYTCNFDRNVFIGKNVTIKNSVSIHASVFINDNCKINEYVYRHCTFNKKVEIGENVKISINNFVNSNTTFCSIKGDRNQKKTEMKPNNIIGMNCMIERRIKIGQSNIICNRVTICENSTIQDNVYIEGNIRFKKPTKINKDMIILNERYIIAYKHDGTFKVSAKELKEAEDLDIDLVVSDFNNPEKKQPINSKHPQLRTCRKSGYTKNRSSVKEIY